MNPRLNELFNPQIAIYCLFASFVAYAVNTQPFYIGIGLAAGMITGMMCPKFYQDEAPRPTEQFEMTPV